jgi:2-hydroxychromene-2-carboxylate isomerase
MAVQKLADFSANYTLAVVPHLVSAPAADYQGDHQRFDDWARRDAASVADGFGVRLGNGQPLGTPNPAQVAAAQNSLAAILVGSSPQPALADFTQRAIQLGDDLWRGPFPAAAEHPASTPADLTASAQTALAEGDQLRAQLGHYQGAMFWFDGEWYWGLDRLHLLEARLQQEGYAAPGSSPVCPLPTGIATTATGKNCSNVRLEYFPSLRSPYTAIGHPRVLELIEHTGVTVRLRPVMPMLMRGIPAPREKQNWIITDASREARFHEAPFGNFVDPFGDPVRRAFALFPAAERLGKGLPFTTAYLSAAWAQGIDITSDTGLAQVANAAGLDYATLQQEAAGDDWEALLTDNVNDMLAAGLWGVPSFRVTGGNGPRSTSAFACWGQDRIWRVAEEIIARA